MRKDDQILLWVAGFAGVLLLYSAYKGKMPLALIESYTSGAKPAATTPGQTPDPGAVGGSGGGGGLSHEQATLATGYSVNGGMVVDSVGNPVAVVPEAYANNPGSYIPSNIQRA